MDIFAGDAVDAPVAVSGGPDHVRVIAGEQVDEAFESCAEGELSDVELLGLAAEEAADAVQRGVLGCGNTTFDELEVRRAQRRAARRRVASAQRTTRVGGVA